MESGDLSPQSERIRRRLEFSSGDAVFVVNHVLEMTVQGEPSRDPWPHAPPHFVAGSGTYMVTAGTYGKERYFSSAERLDYLVRSLFRHAEEFDWELQAWSVFSNHYHFIARSPDDSAESLTSFIGNFHRRSATWVNRQDGVQGRRVWHNFRESQLTYERSFLARMSYVINNAVKHGLVESALNYPWCSAAWFERSVSDAFHKTVTSFKTDRLELEDDFEV